MSRWLLDVPVLIALWRLHADDVICATACPTTKMRIIYRMQFILDGLNSALWNVFIRSVIFSLPCVYQQQRCEQQTSAVLLLKCPQLTCHWNWQRNRVCFWMGTDSVVSLSQSNCNPNFYIKCSHSFYPLGLDFVNLIIIHYIITPFFFSH